MSSDGEAHRPSIRFRDKFSRMKEKVKDKLRDKAIKHNITRFVHENITQDPAEVYSQTTRHGFRQHMHHFKDVLKNKTHYESIKDKIKDKIDDKFDLHQNKTYPKGFYDSVFSPESETGVYLQTALICLWVIAVLCIIPTIVVIFLPARKKSGGTTSTNMIFFHIFLCELCYLTYVLLAMINVAKDFHLGATFCDIANYGMYVTIPIMQFALLFLSLERLSRHFALPITCVKVFTKSYLVQVILCAIWILLLALLVTFMFIKKQFNFSFIKDQVAHLAPPILGDVVGRLASRRHHCSIDGRLSSVFKTAIIILFVLLIVKPILISIGMNVFSPFCCPGKRKKKESHSDRQTTKLVTIFLLLNFFFSFPFYFASMFKSIFSNIDATKDTFSTILKICFILRIMNIIFECLAFYIFERNTWRLLSKLCYYGTCKKFPILNASSDVHTKDPEVLDIIKKSREPSTEEEKEEEEEEEEEQKPRRKNRAKQRISSDDDAASRRKSTTQTPEESEDDEVPIIKPKRRTSIKTEDEDDQRTTRKKTKSKVEEDSDEVVTTKKNKRQEEEDDEPRTRRKTKPKIEDEDVDEDGGPVIIKKNQKIKRQEDSDHDRSAARGKRKSKTEVDEEAEDESEEPVPTRRKSQSRRKDEEEEVPRKHRTKQEDDDDDDEEVRPTKKRTAKVREEVTPRKSRPRKSSTNAEDRATTTTVRHHPRPKQTVEKEYRRTKHHSDEKEQFLDRPKSKSRVPNGASSSHHRTSSRTRANASEAETTSQTSQTSTKQVRHTSKKKPRKDRRVEILEMSHDV